ncbi:MAG: hypothetical protein RI565_05385 [Schleiferiaceae bacterium]|nr:hypothetical protein [Schleiferiaceae bacterium]
MEQPIIIVSGLEAAHLAKVYQRVFRTHHQAPGYALLSFQEAIGSRTLRRSMLALKRGLASSYQQDFRQELDALWLTRFDQQNTTQFHRDNAPRESFLVLGYEPTPISSHLQFADYHRFMTEQGLTAAQYYERYNPLFHNKGQHLKPYRTEPIPLDSQAYQIAVINNSELDSPQTCGLLHRAVMQNPDPQEVRVVNSMMLYGKSPAAPPQTTPFDERTFWQTDQINR